MKWEYNCQYPIYFVFGKTLLSKNVFVVQMPKFTNLGSPGFLQSCATCMSLQCSFLTCLIVLYRARGMHVGHCWLHVSTGNAAILNTVCGCAPLCFVFIRRIDFYKVLQMRSQRALLSHSSSGTAFKNGIRLFHPVL